MMFGRLRNLFVIGGVILALIPSLTVGLGVVSLPPEIEKRFAFVGGVVGLLVFFVVLVARTSLMRLKRPFLITLFVGSTAIGLVLAGWLVEMMDAHIRSIDDRTQGERQIIAYVQPNPADYSPELRRLVEGKYRGRTDAALKAERQEVLELMNKDSIQIQREMLILLGLAHALILFGILVGAFAALKAAGRHADDALR